MNLKELQKDFVNYLTVGDTGIESAIKNHGNVSRGTRLGIYQNAYRVRLREAIDNDHPVIGTYLGDDLFDEMVAGYIDTHPSQTHTLRHFSDHLPSYLKNTDPFKNHPVIAEIAQFERLLLDAFDAPDADRAVLQDLQRIPPEHWPELVFRFHPSVQRFTTYWNPVECWQAIKQGQVPPEPDIQADSEWLIWRNGERLTEFRSLSPLENQLITRAIGGQSFAYLCDIILGFVDEDKAGVVAINTIQDWITAGLIASLE